MDPDTVNTYSFYITQQVDSTPIDDVAISYNSSTHVATLDPTQDLLPGTTYEVTITDEIQTADGQSLSDPGTWDFTTDTSPQALTATPISGATNIPVTQNVVVTFDKAMDPATITSSSIKLERSTGSAVGATVSLSSDKRTVTLDPTFDLLDAQLYIVTVTAGAKSSTGLSVVGAPLSWSFSTSTTPHVTTRAPAAGAVNQALDQVITVAFDQDMDASTMATASLVIAKASGGDALPATVDYSQSTHTATLTPLQNFDPGITYRVTLTGAVKSATGATVYDAPLTWTFTTVTPTPEVLMTVPTSGAMGVSVDQSIQVQFTSDVDPATISALTFYLQPLGGSPVLGTVSYDSINRVARIDPKQPLEYGKTYQVTVSAGVLGVGGAPLVGAPVIWFFTVQFSPSIFSDVLTGITPYSDAIVALADRGIITGFIDGTFRPRDPVTRQQIAKMIVLTLDLSVSATAVCPFRDVVDQTGSDPLYPSKYVAVCFTKGITQGKTATTFAPYDDITRQQLITMIARAANLPTPPVSFTSEFTSNQFSTQEHFQNARRADYAGLLEGLQDAGRTFNFKAASTRGECAQLLDNLNKYLHQ